MLAPVEPDFPNYPRITRTRGCDDEHGTHSLRLLCIVCVEWQTAFQGLRYSTHGNGYPVHTISQVGPLHENPPSHDLLWYASKSRFYMSVCSNPAVPAQLFAVVVTASLKVGLRYFLFERFPDICTPDQPQRLVCPVVPVFFTSSVVWGAIGPVRQFGSGVLYHPVLYAMIFGALIPIPFWIWAKRRPKSIASKIFTPVWFANSFNSPPATGINASSSFLVGFISGRRLSSGGPSSTTSRVRDWMRELGSLSLSCSLRSL